MKIHSNNFTGNSIEYFKAEKTIEFSDVPFDFKQINLKKTRKIKRKTKLPKKFVFKPIKEFNPRENNHKEHQLLFSLAVTVSIFIEIIFVFANILSVIILEFTRYFLHICSSAYFATSRFLTSVAEPQAITLV